MTTVKISRERTTEGPVSSVKTTTYETTSRTSYSDDAVKQYKPTVTGRTTVINRTAYTPVSSSRTIERSSAYGNSYGAPAGAYQSLTTTGVQNVKTSRDQEKKDMQDLNERFASYIEKVRFLEAQNRKLADELEKLKQKWGKETTAIKAMYQAELDEARRLLDDAEKEKARLEIRCASLEEQIEELRNHLSDAREDLGNAKEKIEKQNQQLSDYEAEINLLRRRVESLESDKERDKKEIARLQDALNRARIDLDNETLAHIDAENRRQTLEEELEFLKQVHDQEMKELAALAYRDTTAENREFWKNELAQCLREISETYEDKLNAMRGELETYYNMKIQEFRTGATRQNMESTHSKEENKRLRTQLQDLRAKLNDMEARNAQLERELELLRRDFEEKEREWERENTELKNEVVKLRAEMEAILKELQDIMDTKLGLELEIAAYRKLLEGEENRIGLRNVVDSWVTSGQVETTDGSKA
jgi:intermediate filament protein if